MGISNRTCEMSWMGVWELALRCTPLFALTLFEIAPDETHYGLESRIEFVRCASQFELKALILSINLN